jgi:hypothetical protein
VTRRQPSWPFDPLEPLLGNMTDREAAELLGVERRALARWRNGGGMTTGTADRAALGLGLHPANIWGDW